VNFTSRSLLSFIMSFNMLQHHSGLFMKDEIGRRSGGGNVLERERYAIAAGFAFGLVTLGKNCPVHGLSFTSIFIFFHGLLGKFTVFSPIVFLYGD
jgi:anaphase-promoting complex subunit 1